MSLCHCLPSPLLQLKIRAIKSITPIRFFADDGGVATGDFDRGRFCDGLGCGEGVIGSAGAFAALLEALVRPFDVVEYDGRSLLYFFVLVLLPPAIVPNSSRWYRCE